MRKKYFLAVNKQRIVVFCTAILFFCSLFYGCFKIKSIDQPDLAEPDSYFDVTIVCEPNTTTKTEAKGYFGVLMPEGWTTEEYTDYVVLFPDGYDNIEGRFTYNKEYADRLAANFETPTGYYWWGGRSIDDIEIIKKISEGNEVISENFSFTFRIHTDSKTGDFNLRYLIGTDGGDQDPISNGLYVDEKRDITIAGDIVSDEVEIEQPASGQTYSSMDVDISYTSIRINNTGHTYFGSLLPKGWRVEDYTECKVSNEDGTQTQTGSLSYDQYYSDHLERSYDTPDGYYWWGGRTIDNLPINPTNNNLSLKFRVYTDNQTGNYNLRYVVSAGPDNSIRDYLKDEIYYPVSISQGSNIPLKKEPNWELLSPESNSNDDKWDENIDFYADHDYNDFYKRWYGWTGGDIGRSAPLGDGRSIWVWGDSHTGQVSSDRTRLGDQAQFERNFIILQDGEDFSAFKLINQGSPSKVPNGEIKEIFIPTDENNNPLGKHTEWYWPAGSTVYYRDGVPELQVVLSRVRDTGEGGMWAMEGVSADVAILSLPDLELQRIEEYKHRTVHVERWVWSESEGKNVKEKYSLDYGGYVFRDDDGIVYIYGIGDVPGICYRPGFVARVTNGDLTSEWEFYDAKTGEWSTDLSWQEWPDGSDPDATLNRWEEASMDGNPMFVFKDGNKYFGITQPGRCFNPKIEVYDAESPYGPFTNGRAIGVMPKAISQEETFFCSLLAIHPQYSKNGELFFSLSKNYQDETKPWYGQPGTADTYLPYFFRSKNWRDKLNIAERDATDNNGYLTGESGDSENLRKLTDNNENTVFSTSTGQTWIQYQSQTPITARRYTLTSNPESENKDPLHWQLLGSNDGEEWTVIDSRYYAEFDDRLQTINYDVQIEKPFIYLKLDILDSKGGGGLEIAEWQVFGEYQDALRQTMEIKSILVNGEEIEVADEMYTHISGSANRDVSIEVITEDYSTIKDRENPFIEEIDEPSIKTIRFTMVSEDGRNEKEYSLTFNKHFRFSDLIKVKWENTFMLYNDKLIGYNPDGYQWYKNDQPISGATETTYSVGLKASDKFDPTATYHFGFKTELGELRTDAEQIEISQMSVKAYPNPVERGQIVTVEADLATEILEEGVTVEIYHLTNGLVSSRKIYEKQTPVRVPELSGTYVLYVKAGNVLKSSVKMIVK